MRWTLVTRWMFALAIACAAQSISDAAEPQQEAKTPESKDLKPTKPSSDAQEAKPEKSTAKFTVRDVNVYVMSSQGNQLNYRDLFKSTLPGFVGPRRATADRKHANEPSPAGLITFEGQACPDLDVLLEFTNGRFFANWPPAPQKSKRILWAKAKTSTEQGDAPTLPETHWLSFLRKADRLWFEASRRSERFVLYDCEVPLPAPIKVSSAEGGLGLANVSKFALHDVIALKPQGDQWLTGSIAKLDAPPKKEEKPKAKPDPETVFDKPKEAKADGAKKDDSKPDEARKDSATGDKGATEKSTDKPAAAATAAPAVAAAPVQVVAVAANPGGVVVAAPVDAKPGDARKPEGDQKPAEKKEPEAKPVTLPLSKEPQTKDAVIAEWKTKFKDLGLGEPEIEYLLKILAQQALKSDSMTIVARLDDEQLEELLPLEVTPVPEKQIRVSLVVLLDVDPDVAKRVEELVKQLGAPTYADREIADKALRKLGPAARPKLQEALTNADAEIALRAEQIIESLDVPAGAQPGGIGL